MDYSTLRPGAKRLVPSEEQVAGWRADYEQMRGPMFFDAVPDFGEILRVVGDFQKQLNQGRTFARR